MRKYHGPKDYFEAAQDPQTSATELAVLARSAYEFVHTAVAKHPNVTAEILLMITPSDYSLYVQHTLALTIASNPKTPTEALDQIARGVLPFLDNRRGNKWALHVGVRLCCHANTSPDAVAAILDPNKAAVQLRKNVARESHRFDALALLMFDPSARVIRALARRHPVD